MRILTRGDMDGLTGSVLLTHVEKITEIRFAHPKDVQDGKVACTEEDIIVNLPHVKGCGLWFDHHTSEETKLEGIGEFKGRFEVAPSAARVIYNHYRDASFEQYREMLEETDKIDSAQLSTEDVADPKGWVLLAYTLDPRTGLGPEFQKYFRWLVEYVKEVSLEKVLQHPEVKKRVDRVLKENEEHAAALKANARLDGNVIVTDFRGQRNLPVGNRFLVYTLFPDGNVEARIHDGKGGVTTNVAIGLSIFNRTCHVDVGELCKKYGGGGHPGAGTCQLQHDKADEQIKEIVEALKA